ncbi:MAG: alkaline phosphatase family protein [Opitutus sp.]|nr:alkaline phosphatase family protein [Opitutus sp.]
MKKLFALGALACAPLAAGAIPPLILLSLDAFRWDYSARHPAETSQLRQLGREGAVTRALIPVFPTNTFPNHYSIVTGLYPAHHGIINNHFFDPGRGRYFHYNQPDASHDSHWWGGEPIWVTALKQGGQSACWFWPGSEAEISGRRPTLWRPYDPAMPFDQRLDELLAWLSHPAGPGAMVATFYLEETNSVGHKFGPDSPEIATAIKVADDRIGQLTTRLRAAGVEANLVIVSDHGMTPISAERVLILDQYLDLANVQVDFDGPVAGLRPLRGDASAIVRALASLPHAKAYLTEDLPARLHHGAHACSPPIWIVPDEGWEIFPRRAGNRTPLHLNQADHGYDPAFESMRGIFIAHGPSFKSRVTIEPVENIHIYNLLCAALGLTPAPNDGDDRLVRAMLR